MKRHHVWNFVTKHGGYYRWQSPRPELEDDLLFDATLDQHYMLCFASAWRAGLWERR